MTEKDHEIQQLRTRIRELEEQHRIDAAEIRRLRQALREESGHADN